MSEKEKKPGSDGEPEQDAVQRQAPWKSSFSALNYIYALLSDKSVRLRQSDRVTSIALVIGTLCVLLSAWVTPLGKLRGNVVAICDLLAGVVLVLFIINRFGIINALPRRQALLIWQLLLVFAYLGIYLAVNVAVIIAYTISNTSLAPTPAY